MSPRTVVADGAPSARSLPGALAGLVLALVVLWRAALAARALPQELASLGPRRVAASLTTPLAERLRAALPEGGYDFYSLALLTPPEARIQVPRRRKGGTMQGLRSLCFPRRIGFCDPGPGWRAEPGTYLLKAADKEVPSEGLVFLERRGDLELWRAEGSDGAR